MKRKVAFLLSQNDCNQEWACPPEVPSFPLKFEHPGLQVCIYPKDPRFRFD